jgi:hypothetical protein
MKAAGIPSDREHQFCRLNSVPVPFWNFFIASETYHFMIRRQKEPEVVQRDDILPSSDSLNLQHG